MRCPQGVLKICLVVLLAGGLAGVAGCNKLRARDLLNKGVQAYKLGQFDQAEESFKKAAELDPTLINARIYLATAYASQFVEGSPAPENLKRGQEAIAQFKKVLELDPKNLSAIDGIGSMLFKMGSNPFDPDTMNKAKTWEEKHIQLKPSDAEPYYYVGVIDWTLAFRANQDARKAYNAALPKRKPHLKAIDPLPKKLREPFATKYQQTVDDGIQSLNKAIQLRPDYADAMAYLNLLYRQKADMAESTDQREALLKQADALVDKVNEIKQKEASAPPKKSE
jgi:cytochrome c-type biogenesis protein CcmH/NrfG